VAGNTISNQHIQHVCLRKHQSGHWSVHRCLDLSTLFLLLLILRQALWPHRPPALVGVSPDKIQELPHLWAQQPPNRVSNIGLAARLGAGLGIAAITIAVLAFLLVRKRRSDRAAAYSQNAVPPYTSEMARSPLVGYVEPRQHPSFYGGRYSTYQARNGSRCEKYKTRDARQPVRYSIST
jgi:hypothetical protein